MSLNQYFQESILSPCQFKPNCSYLFRGNSEIHEWKDKEKLFLNVRIYKHKSEYFFWLIHKHMNTYFLIITYIISICFIIYAMPYTITKCMFFVSHLIFSKHWSRILFTEKLFVDTLLKWPFASFFFNTFFIEALLKAKENYKWAFFIIVLITVTLCLGLMQLQKFFSVAAKEQRNESRDSLVCISFSSFQFLWKRSITLIITLLFILNQTQL